MNRFKRCYQDQLNWAEIAFEGGTDADREKQTVECLYEEVNELNDAKNDIEVLDAIADIFVVNCQLVSEEGVASVLKKIDLCGFQRIHDIPEYLGLFNKITKKSGSTSYSYLLGLWCLLADAYEEKGVDVYGAICEVTRSNISKFTCVDDYSEEDLQEYLKKESSWIESNSRYSGVLGKVVTPKDGSKYSVFRDKNGDGKIMKPSSYIEPQLREFINDTEVKEEGTEV